MKKLFIILCVLIIPVCSSGDALSDIFGGGKPKTETTAKVPETVYAETAYPVKPEPAETVKTEEWTAEKLKEVFRDAASSARSVSIRIVIPDSITININKNGDCENEP